MKPNSEIAREIASNQYDKEHFGGLAEAIEAALDEAEERGRQPEFFHCTHGLGNWADCNECMMIVNSKWSEVKVPRAEIEKVRGALRFYAGLDGSGEWVNHVCDSYSGLVSAFDWNGDDQDAPDEIAKTSLTIVEGWLK